MKKLALILFSLMLFPYVMGDGCCINPAATMFCVESVPDTQCCDDPTDPDCIANLFKSGEACFDVGGDARFDPCKQGCCCSQQFGLWEKRPSFQGQCIGANDVFHLGASLEDCDCAAIVENPSDERQCFYGYCTGNTFPQYGPYRIEDIAPDFKGSVTAAAHYGDLLFFINETGAIFAYNISEIDAYGHLVLKATVQVDQLSENGNPLFADESSNALPSLDSLMIARLGDPSSYSEHIFYTKDDKFYWAGHTPSPFARTQDLSGSPSKFDAMSTFGSFNNPSSFYLYMAYNNHLYRTGLNTPADPSSEWMTIDSFSEYARISPVVNNIDAMFELYQTNPGFDWACLVMFGDCVDRLACSLEEHCEDFNECTINNCRPDGNCEFTYAPDGQLCTGGTCCAGRCQLTLNSQYDLQCRMGPSCQDYVYSFSALPDFTTYGGCNGCLSGFYTPLDSLCPAGQCCNAAGTCGSCTTDCSDGDKRCQGTSVQVCAQNAEAVWRWSETLQDCPDAVCKEPVCASGLCSSTNIAADTEDAGECFGTTGCTEGSCKCDGAGACTSYCELDSECDDGNVCTNSTCDISTHTCRQVDNEDSCFTGGNLGICSGGSCNPISCSISDDCPAQACKTKACNASNLCEYSNTLGGACTMQNGGAGVCSGGGCVPACTGDTQCSGTTPICHPALSVCVECNGGLDDCPDIPCKNTDGCYGNTCRYSSQEDGSFCSSCDEGNCGCFMGNCVASCYDDEDCTDDEFPRCDNDGDSDDLEVCVECLIDGDCDDGGGCSTGTCDSNRCVYTQVVNGTNCTKNSRTGNCCDGDCKTSIENQAFNTSCRSGPVCEAGKWQYVPANNSQICSGECKTCYNGLCIMHNSSLCPQGESCTNGMCAETCTIDACTAGAISCFSGGLFSQCTNASGCYTWSDQQACAATGVCKKPGCLSSVCTQENVAKGAADPDTCHDNVGCNGNRCACDGAGRCVPGCSNANDCDDGNPCTLDSCNDGLCSSSPKDDGTSCSGGTCCAGFCDTTTGNTDFSSSCRSAQPVCTGGSYEYVPTHNGESCSGECGMCTNGYCFDDSTKCTNGNSCTDGSCGGCADICLEGDTQCVGQTMTKECTKINGCLVWGSPEVCANSKCKSPVCTAGTCGETIVADGEPDEVCYRYYGCTEGKDCRCDGFGSCVAGQLGTASSAQVVRPPITTQPITTTPPVGQNEPPATEDEGRLSWLWYLLLGLVIVGLGMYGWYMGYFDNIIKIKPGAKPNSPNQTAFKPLNVTNVKPGMTRPVVQPQARQPQATDMQKLEAYRRQKELERKKIIDKFNK